jgi:hypothetical protein
MFTAADIGMVAWKTVCLFGLFGGYQIDFDRIRAEDRDGVCNPIYTTKDFQTLHNVSMTELASTGLDLAAYNASNTQLSLWPQSSFQTKSGTGRGMWVSASGSIHSAFAFGRGVS